MGIGTTTLGGMISAKCGLYEKRCVTDCALEKNCTLRLGQSGKGLLKISYKDHDGKYCALRVIKLINAELVSLCKPLLSLLKLHITESRK